MNARTLIDNWKAEKSYPYQELSQNPVQEIERKVFDICAVNLHQYLKDVRDGSSLNRRLTFSLLKQAISREPEEMERILSEVLQLPIQKRRELAEILKHNNAEARLQVFQNELALSVDDEESLAHLDRLYNEYLPNSTNTSNKLE